jgi:hypothetical protein
VSALVEAMACEMMDEATAELQDLRAEKAELVAALKDARRELGELNYSLSTEALVQRLDALIELVSR